MPAASNPRLNAALDYGQRGWAVFPIKPRAKSPLTLHGFKEASKAGDTIRAWWRRWPEANVGIATGAVSGFIVLDVDPANGGDNTLAELRARNGELPDTVEALTGGGGRHILFRHPGRFVKCSESELGPGLDVKGDGGYVVGPPSFHPNGRAYAWELSSHPDEVPLAGMPEWIAPKRAPREPAAPLGAVIPEGARNSTLASLGGSMRRRGAGESAIVAALLAENLDRCVPPLAEDEVRAIAASMGRYAAEPQAPVEALGPLTSLPFRTAREFSQVTPEHPEWVAEGLLARGAITELDGKVKGGKSTIAMAMVAAILHGKPFLGRKTQATAVVYLTEERPPTFRALLERMGLADESRLHVLSKADVEGVTWDVVVTLAVQKAREVGADALVADTLSKWAGLKDDSEDNPGPAMEAMYPLEIAADTGLAALMSRHDRKTGGELGDSGRGSSAYSGMTDIILALRRADTGGHTSRRSLLGVGRFEGIPEQLIVEFKDGQYVALGDSADVERKEAREKVLDVLPGPDNPPGPMLDELKKETGSKRSTLQRVIKDLVKEGIVNKNPGAGKTGRGDGFTLVGQEKRAPTIGVTPGHSLLAHVPKTDVPKEPPKGRPLGHKPSGSDVPSPHSLSGRLLSRARVEDAENRPADAEGEELEEVRWPQRQN